MQNIISRRSCREFKEKELTEDQIKAILKCAFSAPSAYGEEPWHFYIIKNKEVQKRILKAHPYSYPAPIIFVVCADRTKFKTEDFWIQDCSAATQNILLGANSLGLGAVWCGVYPVENLVEGIKEALSLPDNLIPFSVVPIGYPQSRKGYVERYNPNVVHILK